MKISIRIVMRQTAKEKKKRILYYSIASFSSLSLLPSASLLHCFIFVLKTNIFVLCFGFIFEKMFSKLVLLWIILFAVFAYIKQQIVWISVIYRACVCVCVEYPNCVKCCNEYAVLARQTNFRLQNTLYKPLQNFLSYFSGNTFLLAVGNTTNPLWLYALSRKTHHQTVC